MRISMDEALLESQHGKCFHKACCDVHSIDARSFSQHLSGLPTLNKLHGQDAASTCFHNRSRAADIHSSALKCNLSALSILRLKLKVHLLTGGTSPLSDQIGQIRSFRVVTRSLTAYVLHGSEVRAHDLFYTAMLHLDANFLASAAQHRNVHLGHACRGKWLFVEPGENLRHRLPKIRTDGAGNLTKRRHGQLILEWCQFFYPWRWQVTSFGRCGLTNLSQEAAVLLYVAASQLGISPVQVLPLFVPLLV
mmetsp:Transcript_67655/g.123517  ORF Transcript_67655/g.123517 Transcript_67655/m.123517 type:complete len:250 (-) Transcript_67655:193-942(-)